MTPFSPRSREVFEWLGARYELPTTIREGDLILQPSIDLWMEIPSMKVVGIRPIDPRAPDSFAEGLAETMANPADGSPRKPARIRVPDAELAESLRRSLESEIEIRVAPVPELDDVVTTLSEHLQTEGDEPAYLDGFMAPAVVAGFFTAAARLFALAPWKHVDEAQVLRVDIPSFGIDGAVLCIIGGSGQDFGLLLFRSPRDYEDFSILADDVNRLPAQRGALIDWSLLSLSFNRKRDMPPMMLAEIAHHRWVVAGPKAYPLPMVIAPDGTPCPSFTERDYTIMTGCAEAFLDLFTKHRRMFAEDDPETIRESFLCGSVEVTLTAPYPAPSRHAGDFCDDPSPAIVAGRTAPHQNIGRNDPCPCGSGKKYKKCHLDADLGDRPSSDGETVHEMDFRLVQNIVQFAVHRYGNHWLSVIEEGIGDDEPALQLFLPWVAWTADVDRKRIAETYLELKRARLSEEEQAWFAAQLTAWLSIWEVTRVEPGTVEVRDLLTGERRSVQETLASQSLVARDTLLARVVDFRGTSYFGGMYARVLPPREASAVIATVRGKLRIRKGDVPVERLRDVIAGHQMIHRWADAVVMYDEYRSKPPLLTNTDGDPLRFVTDSYSFDETARGEIEKRIEAMDGVDGVSSEDGETIVVFVRPGNRVHKNWDNTVTGRVLVTRNGLKIETNSDSRADALQRRVRDACAGLLGAGKRKTESPARMAQREKARPAKEKRRPPEATELEALREAKEAHYRDWLDLPVPILGGKTPRAAARAKKSREPLDLLLREIENHEARIPEDERFDVSLLRTELGMEE